MFIFNEVRCLLISSKVLEYLFSAYVCEKLNVSTDSLPLRLFKYPTFSGFRCMPLGTTVSAVDLPVERAMLDNLWTGFWLANNDLWGELPSTARFGVSETPVAVTSIALFVSIIIFKVWLSGHRWHQLRAICRFSSLFARSRKIPGVDQFPGGELVRDRLFVQSRRVWLISRLPCISTGRSPIRNLGTRPAAYSCPDRVVGCLPSVKNTTVPRGLPNITGPNHFGANPTPRETTSPYLTADVFCNTPNPLLIDMPFPGILRVFGYWGLQGWEPPSDPLLPPEHHSVPPESHRIPPKVSDLLRRIPDHLGPYLDMLRPA
jgi:hypothetical protein